MTATFLVSTNTMAPLPKTTIPSDTRSSIVPFGSKSPTDPHNDIVLSITSPALVKKKGSLDSRGRLTPTSLRILHSSMTTTQRTATTCRSDHRPPPSALSRRLKRQESEPVTSVSSKERVKVNGTSNNNNSTLPVPAGVAGSPPGTEKSADSHGRRRQIFGSFWEAETFPSPIDRQTRSASVDIPAIPMPSPMIRSKSEGHGYTQNSSSKSHFHPIPWKQLPVSTLPSPLQRLRKNSGGVYPLVQPKSILRRHDDTEPSSDVTPTMNVTSMLADCDRISSCSISTISDTNHSGASGDSDAASSASNQRKAMVHFDPRVTVTELAERDHERIWYSDAELSRFKFETVLAARTYLTDHPSQLAVYSQATFDPVTKTMRKRALFSMPALADVRITEQDEKEEHRRIPLERSCDKEEHAHVPSTEPKIDADACKLHPRLLLSLLAFEEDLMKEDLITMDTKVKSVGDDSMLIRHILIVDHNPWILDLFTRSMRTMFDCVEYKKLVKSNIDIQCASTVSGALSIIQQAKQIRHPPFDLIIAEQQPFIRQDQHENLASDTNASLDVLTVNTPTSSDIVSSDMLSGSELLFRHVSEKEKILLVSVSSSRFASGGSVDKKGNADLVWGKPPPRMDAALRTQLLRALQMKRQQWLEK